MTEAQWLTCPVPGPMLTFLRSRGCERPLLLFVAACLRRQPRLRAARPRHVLELVKQRADGSEVTPDEWRTVCALPWGAGDAASVIAEHAARAATRSADADTTGQVWAAELGCQASLLRCLVGNPFRAVSVEPGWLAWQNGTVGRLAQSIDAEQAFDQLPVLADALEEAGCTDLPFLEHCRGTAHTMGCWVLDALLSRGRARTPNPMRPDPFLSCLFCGQDSGRPATPDDPRRCAVCLLRDRYDLVKPIACGERRSSQVWRARAAAGGDVAIKIIPLSTDYGHMVPDATETQRLAELQHPYLLQTFLREQLAGPLVIVSELAQGSLRSRLGQGRPAGQAGIPPAELLGYFCEAAEALDYLHNQGVLHGSVRPSNLLLGFDGHVRVADVGSNRIVRVGFEGVNYHAGDMGYFAAEIWRNKAEPASDQFALAVTYAELRQGRRPFSARSVVEIMTSVLQHRPDLDGLTEPEQAIIRRAVNPEPAQRYRDCRAFASALATALALASRRGAMAPAGSRGRGLRGALERWTSRWRGHDAGNPGGQLTP